MDTFSALLATGELPAQAPVTRICDVSADLRLNKRLSKQSWGWWFETRLGSLLRHSNVRLGIGSQYTVTGSEWSSSSPYFE